ncbi:MAG: GerAB/ArcD/ProY family transporter, partial [Christensenellales bacterium]
MKGRIGAKEIWASVLVSLIGRLVFLDPVTFVNQPGQSGWMMPLIALPIGLFMLLLAKKLSAYGGPVACAQRVLGAGLGCAVIVLWAVWLTLLMAISVGKMISVTRYYFFPLTNISQTALLYVVPMCLIAFGGAVCIARSARLVWCIPFVALLVLVAANLPNMDWSNVS